MVRSVSTEAFDNANEQVNGGLNVLTGQVQETVHIFFAIIIVMILIFLIVHIFIRFHYKAKTDYALNELREKFEKNSKAQPSAFAMPKDSKSKGSSPKPVEILMEPEQLAPMVHHVALAPPRPAEEPNKNIYYKPNS